MPKDKKGFVVRILASVHTEEDKEFENPKPVLIDVSVRARTVSEAQEKVGLALAEQARLQMSTLDRQAHKEHQKQMDKRASAYSSGVPAQDFSWTEGGANDELEKLITSVFSQYAGKRNK